MATPVRFDPDPFITGTYAAINVPIFDKNGNVTTQADLQAGWSAKAAVRPYAESPVVLYRWSTTPTGPAGAIAFVTMTTTSPLTGQDVVTGAGQLIVTAAASASWVDPVTGRLIWEQGEYGFDVTDPSGVPEPLLWGVMRVQLDAARL